MKKISILIVLFIFWSSLVSPALADVKFCTTSEGANHMLACSDRYGQHNGQRGCDGNLFVGKLYSCENDLCVEHWQVENCSVSGSAGSLQGPAYTCGNDPYFGVSCVPKNNAKFLENVPQLHYAPSLPPDPCAGIQAEDSGARFSAISGQVEIRRDCAPKDWHFAHQKSVLNVDDHVKTGEDSNTIIGFADLTTFELKPESEIIISTPPSRNSKIGLVLGKIWANVKKMQTNGTMEIDMSQGVAGIKGTTFVLSEDGKNSTLKVIEGTVAFTSKADKKTTLVSTGETITADKNGSQTKQTFDIAAETKSWKNVDGTNKRTGAGMIVWVVGGLVALLLLILGYLKFIKRKGIPVGN